MTQINYKDLGFKCGLEIHQQLECHKLFCNCPSIISDEKSDFIIERRIRVAAGETGEIDVAAEYEFAKKRKIIYEGNNKSSCLVETDSEPPHKLNKDALEIALQVSLLLNAKPIDEIQIMRKTVVDGSNTSGFQRTILIATDGYLETSKGRVNIPTICLEEDAARKIRKNKDEIIYRLDRLGIPLIEIATDASIKNPEHCKEVASQIGMILRSTEHVKRGLGTIRQDVNISIKGHPRVEVKGFQDLRNMPKIINYEVKRQLEAIKKEAKIKPHVRNAESNSTTKYLRPMPGSSRMYPETDILQVQITKKLLNKIKIPELITEKTLKLEKQFNLTPELAKEVLTISYFKDLTKEFTLSPLYIAKVIIEIPKEIKKRFSLDTSKLTKENFQLIFKNIEQNKVPKDAVIEILKNILENKKIDISKYKAVSKDKLESEVKKIIKDKPGISFNAYMGLVMAKFKGSVSGKKAAELIKKFI